MVAAVKASMDFIGMCKLAEYWGIGMLSKIRLDFFAAMGTMNRWGNGNKRHARVGTFWRQEGNE